MSESPFLLFRAPLQLDRTAPGGFMGHFVAVPDEVVEELGLSGAERMEGELNGTAFRRALFWRPDGTAYVRFGKAWLRDAQVQPGDRVTVLLGRDPDPDHVPVPEELAEALEAHPAAPEAWEALTPGRRRSLAYSVERGKREATRRRRAEKVVDELLLEQGIDPDGG